MEDTAVKREYRHSAIKLILLTMITYMISYLGRKSWNSNIPEIMDYFFDGKGEDLVGLVGMCFFISYAVGQVVHGLLCSKYNPKWMITGALLVASTCNFLVGIMPKNLFFLIKYIWIINGFAMASLWSLMIRIFQMNLAQKHIKASLFAMSFPVSLGYFISYGLASLFSLLKNYKFSFYTAAILMVTCAITWFFSIDKLLEHCYAEKIDCDSDITTKLEDNSGVGEKKDRVSKSFYMLFAVLALFAIVDNLLKDGLIDWTPTILKQNYDLANWASILLAVAMPAFAVLGSFLSLYLNKKFSNYIVLCGIFFTMVFIVVMGLIFSFNLSTWIVPLALIVIVYILMSAINNVLTNIFPLKVDKGIDAGKVAGLIDGFCYVGSAISAYGLGLLKTKTGNWNVMFYLFACLAGVCVLLSAIILIFSRKKSK